MAATGERLCAGAHWSIGPARVRRRTNTSSLRLLFMLPIERAACYRLVRALLAPVRRACNGHWRGPDQAGLRGKSVLAY